MTAPEKFRKVLREFRYKTLMHGTTGDVVTDRDMALAIAYSEAKKIEPNYGQYKCGGEIYKTGGELMKLYRADDFFPLKERTEFMFDDKEKAILMASDYETKVIHEDENYYVDLETAKMADGGEINKSIKDLKSSLKAVAEEDRKSGKEAGNKENSLFKAIDNDKKIEESEFKKIIGDENPSRIQPVVVSGMRFEKCLFSPHYKKIN